MNHKETREQYQKLLDKLADIMHPMNDVALAQSKFRCPYRNKDDLCTAKFGCRNQRKAADWIKGDAFTCAHDNKLDYRNFWEMPGEGLGEPQGKNREKSKRYSAK